MITLPELILIIAIAAIITGLQYLWEGTVKQRRMLLSRIKCLWFVLSSQNVIVIHSIKEVRDEEGKVVGRIVGTQRRTDYNTESDFLSMKAAIFNAFGHDYVTVTEMGHKLEAEESEYEENLLKCVIFPFEHTLEEIADAHIISADIPEADKDLIRKEFGKTLSRRKQIVQIVDSSSTRYEEGFTRFEIENLLRDFFPEVSIEAFGEALGVHTALLRDGQSITYHSDVTMAITCVVEKRQPTVAEWD